MGFAGSQFHCGPGYLQDPLTDYAMSVEDLQRTRGGNSIFGLLSGSPYQVDTIAVLKALDLALVADGLSVIVLGYHAAGDGGGGTFTYSIASAATDNGGTVIAPTVGSGRWLRSYSGLVNLRWFGALGDGATDDLAAVQAAISTGKSLFAPPGEFRLSAAVSFLTHNQSVFGCGAQTRFVTTSATADIFSVGNGTDEVRNLIFRNFVFWSSVVKSAGACINARKLVRSSLEGVFFGTQEDFIANGSRLYDGLRLVGFDQNTVSTGFFITNHDGLVVAGDGSGSAGLFIGEGTRIVGCGRYGLHVAGDAGGIYINDADISACGSSGLRFSKDITAAINREVFLSSTVTIDGNTGKGIDVQPNGVTYLELTGTWIATNGGGGVVLDGANAALVFKAVGVHVFNNTGNGISANGSTIILEGSFLNSNTGSGVACGSSVINATIIGNVASSNTNHGIELTAGIPIALVTENTCVGNTLAGILNALTNSATISVQNNIGHVTENTGSATVLNTTTSIVVNHGLVAAPTVIDLTPISTGQTVGYFLSNLTSTQFTINLVAAATADRTFIWRAATGPR